MWRTKRHRLICEILNSSVSRRNPARVSHHVHWPRARYVVAVFVDSEEKRARVELLGASRTREVLAEPRRVAHVRSTDDSARRTCMPWRRRTARYPIRIAPLPKRRGALTRRGVLRQYSHVAPLPRTAAWNRRRRLVLIDYPPQLLQLPARLIDAAGGERVKHDGVSRYLGRAHAERSALNK